MRGRPVAWLAVALVGNAAAVALIDAGPFVRYQHYAVFGPWTGVRLVALCVIVLQALVVAWAIASRWGSLVCGARRCWPGWRIPLLGLAMFLVSATVSRDIAFYVVELLVAFAVVLINLGTIVLFAAAIPDDRLSRLRRWADRVLGGDGARTPPRIDRFAVRAALWATVVSGLLSLFVYERHPHIPDEISYIYHARYFADGALSMPTPPVVEAFDLDLMTYESDRWYSPVPPGWPAVLAVGERIGAGWLVNPILAGMAVLLCYLLVWSLFDRWTARLVALLLCVSPWFLFMAMSYLTHTASLVATLAACLALARFVAGGSITWAFVSGICLGAVGLIRPLEAVIVGLALAGWSLAAGRISRKLVALVALGLGSMALTVLHLPYNRHLTGSATTMPIMAYTDAHYGPGSNALGFGPERGLGWTGLDPFPGHGPADVVVNADLNAYALNIELFGWSAGSLAIVLAFLLSGSLRRKEWGFVGLALLVIGIHSLYWFSGGPDFGARYWYLIIIPCVVLTARGIEYLCDCVGEPGRVRVLAAVGAAALVALLVFMPWRSFDKYRGYRGMRPDIGRLIHEYGFDDGLVIVRGVGFPDYASAAIYNEVAPGGSAPIFAWDRGAEVRALLAAAYSDRRFWMIDGPSVTGARYAVVAGPMTAREMLELELPEVPLELPEVPVSAERDASGSGERD